MCIPEVGMHIFWVVSCEGESNLTGETKVSLTGVFV